MRFTAALVVLCATLTLGGCRRPEETVLPPEEAVEVPTGGEVVVFVEPPRYLPAPLLKMIADRSGMTVQAVYREDSPADFVDRVRAETRAGRADVFLGLGTLTAVSLTRDGLAVPFRPERARPVPPQ